jgi:outer membrane biogenesis lipoprotein LolB
MRKCARSSTKAAIVSFFLIFNAFIVLLALPACQAGPEKWGMGPSNGPDTRPIALLAQELYAGANPPLTRFAARGELVITQSGKPTSYSFELIAAKPDNYRFTIFDPLGRPVFRVAQAQGKLSALDYYSEIFYEAEDDNMELSSFLPLPLSSEELLAIFTGNLPGFPQMVSDDSHLPAGLGVAYIKYLPAGGDKPIAAKVQGGPLWIRDEEKRLLELTKGQARNPEWRVSYGEYNFYPRSDVEGKEVLLPQKITLEWDNFFTFKLQVSYQELILGVAFEDSLFDNVRPQGFKLEKI